MALDFSASNVNGYQNEQIYDSRVGNFRKETESPAGFEIVGRVTLKHKKSGRIFR